MTTNAPTTLGEELSIHLARRLRRPGELVNFTVAFDDDGSIVGWNLDTASRASYDTAQQKLADGRWVLDKATGHIYDAAGRRLGNNSHRSGYWRVGGLYAHRVIVEHLEGRRLYDHETVDHVDGDLSNNTPSNLEIVTREENSRRAGLAYQAHVRAQQDKQ